MGLTKEVRDFFTERIHKVLNAKLEAINKQINERQVQLIAIQKFCEKWDLPLDIVAQAQKLVKEEERIDAEQNKLKQKVESAISKARTLAHERGEKDNPFNRYNSYYGMKGSVEQLKDVSFAEYRDEIIGELHPDLLPQIKKIEKIKDEAQSVVMLSTTEAKLVLKLSKLLKNYGGDISELLELIPDLE